MRSMARSILVTETFIRATKAQIGTGDDSAALTLMSTDIERINIGFRALHDIWASTILVAFASWMLYNHLGPIFAAPIGIVIICLLGLSVVMKFIGNSQRLWMSGVQKRVGLTATVISNMKNLKISGLSTPIRDFVQKLRVSELAAGVRFRKISITAALLGFTPLLISPPVAFAFAQRKLDAATMFTSLSWLLLLTDPLSQIFQNIPEILSGLACLGRIQAFLECETRHDFRQVISSSKSELHPVVIKNGKFGWEANNFALQNINTRVPKSSLTIIVGPVGSGKSTMCKTLLGEIPFSEGSVIMSTRFPHVAFCDQPAFLSNGSIRDNIVGFSSFDDERYAEIIHATALSFDLETLPQGDKTNVGSGGIILSGGQKQRLSLARALYLESDLLVLDDVFSGLDADTEEQVFRRVFAPGGLLKRRQATVVLCTHSIKHLPAADNIIALGNGTIVEQGSFDKLMSLEGYVQRLGLKDSSGSDTLSEKTEMKKGEQELKPQLYHTATRKSSLATGIDPARQVGDKTVYKHYFKSMGKSAVLFSLMFTTFWGFFTNFPTICKLNSFFLVMRGIISD